jgi:integrase
MQSAATPSVSQVVSHREVRETEALIKKLTAPTHGELRLFDKKVPYLLLRWRAKSKPTKTETKPRWYICKRIRGRLVQSVLGELSTWPEVSLELARELATAALADLAKGVSPSDVRASARKAKADKAAEVIPMGEVWKRHKAILVERERCPEHIREMQLLAEQSEKAGVDDLRCPDIAARAETWLMKQKLAPSTRRRRRGFFKDMGDTARRWWKLDDNPFSALEVSAPDTVPDIELFSLPQCCALVSDEGLADPWGQMGALLLYHGLRLQEGLWMHDERIDEAAGVLRVTPPTAAERKQGHRVKRNKAREVPLQAEWLELRKRLPKQADGYLFPIEFRKLNRKTHWRYFHAWCKSVGIDAGSRSPHTLRHQRATVGLASNEGELRLQLALGHAGAAMTKHYAQKAMRWKKAIGHWHGVMRFRDPAEFALILRPSSA